MCAILPQIFTSNSSLPSLPVKTCLGSGYLPGNRITQIRLSGEVSISKEIHLNSFSEERLIKEDSSGNRQISNRKSSKDQVILRCQCLRIHSKRCSAIFLADKSHRRDEGQILTKWILVLAQVGSGLLMSSLLCLHRTFDHSMEAKPTISSQK